MHSNIGHQAYLAAKAEYDKSSTSATIKNLFNALLPYLKEAAEKNNYQHFIRTLKEMDKYEILNNPFHANQVVWSVISMLSKLRTSSSFNGNQFSELFSTLKKLNYNRPSKEHSLVLKFFLKRPDHYFVFEDFIAWWDKKNLQADDYLCEKYKEITYPALVETLYSAISKNMLSRMAENNQHTSSEEKNKMLELAGELDALYLQHSNYKFFPYYSTKLKLAAGFTDGLLTAFLPFARQNSNHFWVWDLLTEFFDGSSEIKRALLCRAMLCQVEDTMKIGVNTKLFESFLANEMYDEAHEELEKIIKIRELNKWRIPANVQAHQQNDWFTNSINRRRCHQTYQKFAAEAENVLLGDQTVKMAVVTHFLVDRKLAFVITEDLISCRFKPSRFNIHKPDAGVLLEVITQQKNEVIEIVWAKRASVQSHEKLLQEVTGKIRIQNAGIFGIANGVFIREELIRATNIKDGDNITMKAIRSYDKKKNAWGWAAVSLKKKEK